MCRIPVDLFPKYCSATEMQMSSFQDQLSWLITIGSRHQPGALTDVNPAKRFITQMRQRSHLHTEDAIRLDKNGAL